MNEKQKKKKNGEIAFVQLSDFAITVKHQSKCFLFNIICYHLLHQHQNERTFDDEKKITEKEGIKNCNIFIRNNKIETT